jgi:hypothetical protein
VKILKQQNTKTAIANKIKKWVETAQELSNEQFRFAIPITRLTSIKSLCQDEVAAAHFALYLAKILQAQMQSESCPSHLSPSEWETHTTVVANAVTEMERYIENPLPEGKQPLSQLLKQIDELQGNDFRNVHWTTVHFVKSGNLLKLEYAIRCFTVGTASPLENRDFPYYAYKLAREFTEFYAPRYGTGLIPESVPKLLEIAEFWCQYYFGQNLSQKFPKLAIANYNSTIEHLNLKRDVY